jgi:hypothetical protein
MLKVKEFYQYIMTALSAFLNYSSLYTLAYFKFI